MIAIATKFKTAAATAAVAAVLATGFAGASFAQGSNPFAGAEGEQTKPFVKHTPTPNEGSEFGKRTDPNEGNEYVRRGNPNEGNQFGNRTETQPKTGPNTQFKTDPFGNERRDNPNGSADDRLSRYLVGVWNGRLTNGQSVKVAFRSDGGFAIVMGNSEVAQVGRYTVQNGQIRLQLAAMCSLTTKRCQRFDQVRSVSLGFRPLNASSFQVQDGVLHRAA